MDVRGIRHAGDASAGDGRHRAGLAESSGRAGAGRRAGRDLRFTLDDPRVALVLPASTASRRRRRTTSFDGFIYLVDRDADGLRGRGLAGLATRHAVAIAGGARGQTTYLGVFSGTPPRCACTSGSGSRPSAIPDLLLE